MRKHKNDYRSIDPDPKTVRDEINRNRIVENHHLVNYNEFHKSENEKKRLKALKKLHKESLQKKN